jgi:futalosine hydrolase
MADRVERTSAANERRGRVDTAGLSGLAIVCAAPAEAAAVRALGLPVETLGVGRLAAALGTVDVLASAPSVVLCCGVAGAYGDSPAVGSACLVRESVVADEGVALPDGRFLDAEGDLGLPGARGPFVCDEALLALLPPDLPRVRAATVGTCSGRDDLATAYRERTGAGIETMESAAVAAACARRGVPLVELRTISNRCGDRERGGWDLPAALARLTEVLSTWRDEGLLAALVRAVREPNR